MLLLTEHMVCVPSCNAAIHVYVVSFIVKHLFKSMLNALNCPSRLKKNATFLLLSVKLFITFTKTAAVDKRHLQRSIFI